MRKNFPLYFQSPEPADFAATEPPDGAREAAGQAPHFRCLTASQAENIKVGNGAQRRERLDGLVSQAILAEADEIVRQDIDDMLAERGKADRWARIVRKNQECAAVGMKRRAMRVRSSPLPCRIRGCRNEGSGRRSPPASRRAYRPLWCYSSRSDRLSRQADWSGFSLAHRASFARKRASPAAHWLRLLCV